MENQIVTGDLLPSKTFIFNYDNLHSAKGRHETYLCFKVEKRVSPDSLSIDFGYLQNSGSKHAEVKFLEYLKETYEDLCENGVSGESKVTYSITMFCSWSPCDVCSFQLNLFLTKRPNLSLTILFSRLYFGDQEKYKKGLRMLKQPRVQIKVMHYEDFVYCWNTFVESNQSSFEPWNELNENSKRVTHDLDGILQE